MSVKVLFCDDNKNNIRYFNEGISPETIIQSLSNKEGVNKYYAERFLARCSEAEPAIKLIGITTKKYSEMLDQINIYHVDAKILLLDCALEDDQNNTATAIVEEVLEKITLNKDRVCILATSFNTVKIFKKIFKSKKLSEEFIEGGDGLLNEDYKNKIQILTDNIIQGVLLYEKKQKGDKYDDFIHELMDDYNYAEHPSTTVKPNGTVEPNGFDKGRKDLFKKYFNKVPWSHHLSGIIADMANSERRDLDLRSAWYLAQMKYESLFEEDVSSVFIKDENINLHDRWDQNNQKYFIPWQKHENRIDSLCAFGEMCEKLFIHDPKKQKNNDITNKIALKKAKFEKGKIHGENNIIFELDWPIGDVIQNYNDLSMYLFASMQSKKIGEMPDHSTSSAIVAFIMSTQPTTLYNNVALLGGVCTKIMINQSKLILAD